MIVKGRHNIIDIRKTRYPLKSVYHKRYLVWSRGGESEEAQSCFGRGYWVNNLPWLNNDAWKNN